MAERINGQRASYYGGVLSLLGNRGAELFLATAAGPDPVPSTPTKQPLQPAR